MFFYQLWYYTYIISHIIYDIKKKKKFHFNICIIFRIRAIDFTIN